MDARQRTRRSFLTALGLGSLGLAGFATRARAWSGDPAAAAAKTATPVKPPVRGKAVPPTVSAPAHPEPVNAPPSPTPQRLVSNSGGEETPVTSPAQALLRLIEGNQRFALNQTTTINESSQRRAALAKMQAPFATVFSCVDSRVPPELVFDRGLGDLFVIRTAGHVLDNAVLGSLEFGVEELHIPLILVMGHERCGAVKATLDLVTKGGRAEHEIQTLVNGIRPSILASMNTEGDPLDRAVIANTQATVSQLKRTPILSEAVTAGRVMIVGGRYDLDTGVVTIIG